MAGAYPLETLLEIYRREREACEETLASSHRKARERDQDCVAAERVLGLLEGSLETTELARDWHHLGVMVTRSLGQLRNARQAALEAWAEVAAARAEYTRTLAREQALEKHRERFLHARRVGRERQEQVLADDLAGARFHVRRGSREPVGPAAPGPEIGHHGRARTW